MDAACIGYSELVIKSTTENRLEIVSENLYNIHYRKLEKKF